MILRNLSKCLLVFALFAAFAAPVEAQTDAVPTTLQTETEPPLPEDQLWDGTAVTGQVHMDLCWSQEGGANPLGGSFVVEAEAAGPDWVTIAVSPESHEVSPPTGPTTEAGCEDVGSFDVTITAPDGVQQDQTATVMVSFKPATAAGDEELPAAPPETGTFAAPSGASATFSLTAISAPSGADEDGDGSGPAQQDADVEGSPAPALGLLPILAVAAAALRRRV